MAVGTSNTLSLQDESEAVMPLSIIHVFRAPVGGLFRHVARPRRADRSRAGHRVGIIADSTTGNARSDETFAAAGAEAGSRPAPASPCAAAQSSRCFRHIACHAPYQRDRCRMLSMVTAPRAAPIARLAFPRQARCARLYAAWRQPAAEAQQSGRAACISRLRSMLLARRALYLFESAYSGDSLPQQDRHAERHRAHHP